MTASAVYDAKLWLRIGVVDPGAVPGGSTRILPLLRTEILREVCGGAETGSTRAVKVFEGIRDGSGVTGPGITNANDNFVVANDNNQAVAIAA